MDSLAKQAAIHGHKPKFKVSFTNFYAHSMQYMKNKFHAFFENNFQIKGTLYSSYFLSSNIPPKS